MMNWAIVPIGDTHDRSHFACGQPSLDRFLKEFARQNQAKDFCRTFVLIQEGEARVYGYYTLSAAQIEREKIPPEDVKKLPKYPVPVVLLGRLAVDQSVAKQKLGRRLLWDALNRAVAVAEQVGVHAVFVEAIDESAARFYAKFGFKPLRDLPLKLFLPVAVIRKTAQRVPAE